MGVVLVEESVAGFCAKDDRRFSGLVDTGFVADYNEALRVLVLRLEEDARDVAMAPPVAEEAAAPAAQASRGEAATWATAAQLDALPCFKFFCLLFFFRCTSRRRLVVPRGASVRVASPGFRSARRRRETRPVEETSRTVSMDVAGVGPTSSTFGLAEAVLAQTQSADGVAR